MCSDRSGVAGTNSMSVISLRPVDVKITSGTPVQAKAVLPLRSVVFGPWLLTAAAKAFPAVMLMISFLFIHLLLQRGNQERDHFVFLDIVPFPFDIVPLDSN